MCPVGWEYATRIDAESPFYTDAPRADGVPHPVSATAVADAPDDATQDTDPQDEPLQHRDPPAGWVRSRSGSWEGWSPAQWPIRLQGWKIHVSATLDNAVSVLDRVTAIALPAQVAFKFLPTRAALWTANAKHADRASAGKFVTIYPRDDAQLAQLLAALQEALDGFAGPYILSDLRVGTAPVFVRYGGIYPLSYRNSDDAAVAAVVTGAALTLTEDVRQPTFTIPPGVSLPDCLAEAWRRQRQDVASPLDRYATIQSLGFSNAGGVYLATLPDGTRHVLREARPHAGLDARGRTAIDRQLAEEAVLSDLRGCPGVQQLIGAFTAWEHRFLVLDYLPGDPLVAWAAAHYPLHYVGRPDDPERIADYRRTAHGIVAQLTAIVERVHAAGWCIGDLHPGNVLVDDEGRVGLLDLEDASPIDEPRRIGMRVIEYCAPDGFSAREADWYAVARVAMNLYVTGWPVEVICPKSWDRHLELVRDRMGAEAATQIAALTERAGAGSTPSHHALSPRIVAEPAPREAPRIAEVVTGLAAFIDWSAQYTQAGGYPGDPVLGGRLPWFTFEAGLAGVVFARARIGHPLGSAVVDRLETVASMLLSDGPIDLYQGLSGVALALLEAGRGERAAAIAAACLGRIEEIRRRDLARGRAGVLLTALEVAVATGDAALQTAALRAYRRFEVDHPPVRASRAGMSYGESGLALLDLMVAHHVGDDRALRLAVQRIRRDAEQCEATPEGPWLVTDEAGGRLLPYLEWGSAGVLAIAGVAQACTGERVLEPALVEGIGHACASRMYVYDGFHHGRAGILAALLAAGEPGVAAAQFQAGHLAANLPRIAGNPCVVGDGLIRLSADLATGAAGVALVLHCYAAGEPFGWLPIAQSSALALAGRAPERPAPAWNRIEDPARTSAVGAVA
jgi:hypothetical protein